MRTCSGARSRRSSAAPGRSWDNVSELARPGAYATTTIGREPVLVVRGHDGELRAMSNVCRQALGVCELTRLDTDALATLEQFVAQAR
jgi:hypothetical protein